MLFAVLRIYIPERFPVTVVHDLGRKYVLSVYRYIDNIAFRDRLSLRYMRWADGVSHANGCDRGLEEKAFNS